MFFGMDTHSASSNTYHGSPMWHWQAEVGCVVEHVAGQCWSCDFFIWRNPFQCYRDTLPSNRHLCRSFEASFNSSPSTKKGFNPKPYYKFILHSSMQVLINYSIQCSLLLFLIDTFFFSCVSLFTPAVLLSCLCHGICWRRVTWKFHKFNSTSAFSSQILFVL